MGVDADPEIAANENVRHRVISDLGRLPLKPETFDLVFARYVLEHLDNPLTVFREVRRVIRPGGHFVFQTPNRFHYVALAARLTPDDFHVWFRIRRRRHRGLPAEDAEAATFPTKYRANDRRRLQRLAAASRFEVVSLSMIEPPPGYLYFHPLAYRAGEVYRGVVDRSTALADLRCVIVGDFRATERTSGEKPSSGLG